MRGLSTGAFSPSGTGTPQPFPLVGGRPRRRCRGCHSRGRTVTNVVAGLEFILKYRFANSFVVAFIFSACGSTPSPTDAGLFTGGGNGAPPAVAARRVEGAGGGAATGGSSTRLTPACRRALPGTVHDASGQGDFRVPRPQHLGTGFPRTHRRAAPRWPAPPTFDCWTLSQGTTTGDSLQCCARQLQRQHRRDGRTSARRSSPPPARARHTHNHSGRSRPGRRCWAIPAFAPASRWATCRKARR